MVLHPRRLIDLLRSRLSPRPVTLLSYSEVARELDVAVNTVKRYVRFLEISYQVVLLRPFIATVTARLLKRGPPGRCRPPRR